MYFSCFDLSFYLFRFIFYFHLLIPSVRNCFFSLSISLYSFNVNHFIPYFSIQLFFFTKYISVVFLCSFISPSCFGTWIISSNFLLFFFWGCFLFPQYLSVFFRRLSLYSSFLSATALLSVLRYLLYTFIF